MKRSYKLGDAFPGESFVQSAIERHFREKGFDIDTSGYVDLLCTHPATRECWHIEAKGKTSDPGLDFRTCVGQLVLHIRSSETRYGIALPHIPEFTAQIAKVSPWVVERLSIHWLLVCGDGTVNLVSPSHGPTRNLSLNSDASPAAPAAPMRRPLGAG